MAASNAVWGIEIGQNALKALKLRPGEDGKVELVAFDVIEHPKLLSQPDADADELVRKALEKFAERNEWQGDKFVIGVPGQQTFARFCKLPPVEQKKIPDIVRFEASQQIPFDMNDVVWDYQVFQAEDMPDVEVGIFAMRKDLVRRHIDRLQSASISPQMIQTIPSALYNFCRFDGQWAVEEGVATVIIDIGSQHTDLVIVEPNSAWTRNIPLGGNSFTDALVKQFKLSFEKAEKLKRTAASSKYARQIFQAMRPVFADLVAEIQRSIGFYSSTHRDVELKQLVACGNAFKLPGLLKYLENNLAAGEGIVKLEGFKNLVVVGAIDQAQFNDQLLSFAPAYGLGLQGLGLGKIDVNLLPPELARLALWRKKQPFFIAAAACIGLAALCPWARIQMDSSALAANEDLSRNAPQAVSLATNFNTQYSQVATNIDAPKAKVEELLKLQEYKRLVPEIVALVHESLPEMDPALAQARTRDQFAQLIKTNPARYKRTNRKQIVIEDLKIEFVKSAIDDYVSADTGGAAGGAASGGFGNPGMMGMGQGGGGVRGIRGRSGTPGGYGGNEGGGTTLAPSDAGGIEEGSGFYVMVSGRLTYGDEQSAAVSLLADELFPRIRAMGSKDGLPFYVPEKDPKNYQGEQNPGLPVVTPYYTDNSGGGVSTFGGPGSRFGGTRGRTTFDPGMGTGAASPEEPTGPQYADPVTGEDMATDWQFRFGFKIKLGAKPADGEAQAAAPEGA